MSFTLERIIYGSTDSSSEMSILAISDHLTPQDASLWRGITSLRPMDAPTFKAARAFGIFAGPADRFVAACAYQIEKKPFYEYIVIPRDVLATLAGNLTPLLALFDQPAQMVQQARTAPVKLNSAEPWSVQQRRAQVEALLGRGIDMPQALRLLGAALHERGLMIHDFPPDTEARLTIIRGLMALLPAQARPDLTFSTNRHEKTMTQARVVFAPNNITTGRWIINWQAKTFADDEILASPYIKRLLALWKGDLAAFLTAIDQMGSVAGTLIVNKNLQNSLTVMAERHALDAQIVAGEEVAPEALKAVMRDIPPEGDLQHLYARRLLDQALDARDADAALIVARAMDQDPVLDRVIYDDLERDLRSRPDAVYSFMRTRLGASVNSTAPDERWAERLKVAALTSLRVAILDGDAETTVNWLRLVAREPSAYGLGEVVHYGILAAQDRARTEPDLAQALILLAVKRDQAALDILLADKALLEAVPNALGIALRSGEGDPASLLQTYGVEVFLVALSRALDAQCPDLFTAASMEQIWALYMSGGSNGNAPNGSTSNPYSAEHLIKALIASPSNWLPTEALETLLSGMLRDKRDDLSHQLIHQVSTRADFLSVVVNAMSESQRSDSESLALIAQIMSVGDLTQQQAVDIYVGLLNAWDWRESDLGIMEQLARAVQQHPHLEITSEVIWNLLAVSGEMKEDFITRVALRRLTNDLETVEDEELLVEDLQRVIPLVAWDTSARAQILAWWRTTVREQTTARLQRIDKALSDGQETKRSLEDLRTVVQAVLAFRRMLGKRSLGQFAEDIKTAYAVLQGVAESFDPSAKRQAAFDPATIRLEMDARAEELSPHELKILANNFKELAQLVSTMADNRSKATLMRRGDDVDRLLMTGETQPHSAVDALKWMAGYLSGTQEKSDEDAE